LAFENLEELSLTGNSLSEIHYFPSKVKILHLNANRFTKQPNLTSATNLLHLGLSFNDLIDFDATFLPNSITSVDLAWNKLVDLDSVSISLSFLPHLKILCLLGNPLFLRPDYYATLLAQLQQLSILDDTPKAELIKECTGAKEITMIFNCTQCHGFAVGGNTVGQVNDKPPDE
jgi:hypothetical protein